MQIPFGDFVLGFLMGLIVAKEPVRQCVQLAYLLLEQTRVENSLDEVQTAAVANNYSLCFALILTSSTTA